MTTAVTIIPTHTGTGPSGPGTATAVPMVPAAATLIPQPRKPLPLRKIVLMSVAGNSGYEIDTKSKKFKKKADESVTKRVNDVWKEVHALVTKIDANASEVSIEIKPNPDATNPDSNVKREIVTISYEDGFGNKRVISQRDIPQEIIVKMDKIRQLVRPNLDIAAQAPLHISMQGFLPKNLTEFLERDFQALEDSLPAAAKPHALRNVLATEAMIQGFSMHLKALIEAKENDLNNPATSPVVPHPPRKKKEEELRKLKNLQAQLDSIDRYAVFRAVATWDNLQTGPIDDPMRARLRTTADTITIDCKRDFQRKEREWQDSHHLSTARKYFGGLKPDAKETHAYQLDLGDLVLPDRWEAQGRRADTDRSDTRSCA